jgi:hypothetical protein
MVVVQFYDPIKQQPMQFYLNETLKDKLDKIKAKNKTKDYDYIAIVDGEEGSGKSVFSFQLCKYIDPTFSIDRVCFTPEEFKNVLLTCPFNASIQYDEAFTGLSSRASLSEINHMLNSLIMQIRQKNLFIIVTLPTFFLLDKYVSMFRAKTLFHVYTHKGRRGFFRVFNRKKKKLLILNGRRAYDYNVVRSKFRGRFTDYYTIDEAIYRKKKLEILMGEKKRTPLNEKHKLQRDALIRYLHEKYKVSFGQLEKDVESYGIHLPRSSQHLAIKNHKNLKSGVHSGV